MSISKFTLFQYLLVALSLSAAAAVASQPVDEAVPVLDRCLDLTPALKIPALPDPSAKATPYVPVPQAIHGLTVLVDFDDLVGTIPTDQIDDFMNLEGFTGFDLGGGSGATSNGSVRDYYYDVSYGTLTYTNTVVPFYIRADETYEHYRNAPFGEMDDLVTYVLQTLDTVYGFDFSAFDADNDGTIDALNVLTAGYFLQNKALHPHCSHGISVTLDGVVASSYENTNLGSAGPQLAVVCHENGHLLFGWPDLYGSAAGNQGNLTGLDLMGTALGDNPPQPNAFFKWMEGWLMPQLLLPTLLPSGPDNVTLDSDQPSAAFSLQIGVNDQFYVFENRQQSGRDAWIGDAGIAIYRVSLSNGVMTDIELVEADGLHDVNLGGGVSDHDLWTAPEAVRFDFATNPAATWPNGDFNVMNVADISACSTAMTFTYTQYVPATLQVHVDPATIAPGWTVYDESDRAVYTGAGSEEITLPGNVYYDIVFHDHPMWTKPTNPTVSQFLPAGTTPTVVSVAYAPPFAWTAPGPVATVANTISTAAIDFDMDGDDDVFVINSGSANQLLRNDGGSFVNVAPAILADADIVGSAWADVDGDGDPDAFLFGANGAKIVLETTGGPNPTFTDVTSRTPAFASIGVVNSASWVDIDLDGDVDLFLTLYGAYNVRLDGSTASPFALTVGAAGSTQNAPNSVGATWGDINRDGWPDLFLCSDIASGSTTGRLITNNQGSLVLSQNMGYAWLPYYNVIDAEFADFNGDFFVDMAHLYHIPNTDQYAVVIYLQKTDGSGFVDTFVPGSFPLATGIETGDFDNDGDIDIVVGSATGDDAICVNPGTFDPVELTMTFDKVNALWYNVGTPTRSISTLDYNGDGAVDLFVGRDTGYNLILHNLHMIRPNLGYPAGHWLDVDLTAVSSHPGAEAKTVFIYSAGKFAALPVEAGGDAGQGSRILHFGLGGATQVDALIVIWESGHYTNLNNLAVDQTISIVEPGAKAMPESTPTYVTTFKPAYPNPFNPVTNIAFSLGRESHVKAVVYSIDGKRIRELVNDDLAAGDHVFQWRGTDSADRNVASGMYFCRIETDSGSYTAKLTLMK